MPRIWIVGWVCFGLACNGGPTEPAWIPCLPNQDEFPPDACALAQGRLQAPGLPSVKYVVSVDVRDSALASWFVASARPVAADGRFELLISQVRPLGTRPLPDRTVRELPIQIHEALAKARAMEPPRALVPVRLVFTPWGTRTETTVVALAIR